MTTTTADLLGTDVIPELLTAIFPVHPDEVLVMPAPRLMRRLWGDRIDAMTIGRRVFVEPGLLVAGGPRLADLIVHELVHVRQWQEKTAGSFLLRYSAQYLLARMRGARHHVAYMSIAAEIEARRVATEIRRLLDN